MFESKKSHLVQTAEFAVAQGVESLPALNWKVNHVLKKKVRIVTGVRKWQTRCLKKNHMFPMTVEQAYALDSKNGNTL